MSDGRGAFLTCPACKGPMSPVKLGEAGTLVDVCGVCRGVWFDWFDGETSSLARHLDTLSVRKPLRAAGGLCPRDGGRLEQHPYLDLGPAVDRCPTCLGLFAARDVIAALQRFHERMPPRSPEPIERSSFLSRLWHAFAG